MTYTVFYDAACPICTREMALLQESNPRGNIRPVPVQGNEALLARHGIAPEAAMTLIHVVDENGNIESAMPALRLLYAQCEGRLFTRVWNVPGLRQLADWGYPHFARHRYRIPRWLLPRPKCDSNQCRR
ncbi:MAG: DUF393 domain-containing protein [Cardiobacteriaceae bacterium]|nr:DUF393 domain-containing protein [Cardiobacteriaceae bacterium]